jgi:signal transduction histidine kinase
MVDKQAKPDRISRDIHELLVCRLSFVAMRLAGVLPLADVRVAERISEAVRMLDEIIKESREAATDVLDLPGDGMETALRVLAAEARELPGRVPEVTIVGRLDSVGECVADHVHAVLRESLRDIATRAAPASIVVRVDDNGVRVAVDDDGGDLPLPLQRSLRAPGTGPRVALHNGTGRPDRCEDRPGD